MIADADNPVVQLCAAGMAIEGDAPAARDLFAKAWAMRRDDYDACIAAHFVARHETTPEDTLRWNALAVRHAEAVPDNRTAPFLASLYLNLGEAHRVLGHVREASEAVDRARAALVHLEDGGYRTFVAGGIDRLSTRLTAMQEIQPPNVALVAAAPSDEPLLSNLLELYIHDLSAVFPNVRLGPDGRFGYPKLPLYWSESDRRFPFLITCDGQVAGFALATRGSPVADDPTVLDVAEFFVVRQYRRAGVGRKAAFALWRALPGKWTVRVSESNAGAVPFWAGVVAEFTNGSAVESSRPGDPSPWRVFSFESRT